MVDTTTTLVTPPARLSFPSLFEATPTIKGGDTLRFQASVLLPPDTDLAPFRACMLAAAKAEWGADMPKLSDRGNPLNPCDGKDLSGYDAGWHYINAKSHYQPAVVDQSLQPILDAAKVYAGCWCHFELTAFAWDNSFGKGISFSLGAIQLVREGDRLDGRKSVADIFKPVEIEGAPASTTTNAAADELFG